MIEERAFTGYIRVVTKSYGLSNDTDTVENRPSHRKDPFAGNEAKSIIIHNSKFKTSGNATFLVGLPFVPESGSLYQMGLDLDLIEDSQNVMTEIWIPFHDIITIIPSPAGD